MTYYYTGKRYPTRDKQSIASQIPAISRRFPKFYQYARATFEDLLPPDSVARAQYFKATTFASAYLSNNGNGTFAIRALPLVAQTAPIFGVGVEDIDSDGNLDLLVTGNFYGPEPEMKRYDALGSLVLKGDGDGRFIDAPDGAFRWNADFNVMNNPRALARIANVVENVTLHLVSELCAYDHPRTHDTASCRDRADGYRRRNARSRADCRYIGCELRASLERRDHRRDDGRRLLACSVGAVLLIPAHRSIRSWAPCSTGQPFIRRAAPRSAGSTAA
jgi:hypothetical protein